MSGEKGKKKILERFLFIIIGISILLIVSSCATTGRYVESRWYEEEVNRIRIAERAKELVGVKNLKEISKYYRNDCTGFIVGLYRELGYNITLRNPGRGYTLSQILYINLRERGLIYFRGDPKRADIVFFRGTTNYSGNRISHVGIVSDIFYDHTVQIIHYGSKGVAKIRMNLLKPHIHKLPDGRIINDFIVKKGKIRSNRLLSAEHFSGYGNLYKFISM